MTEEEIVNYTETTEDSLRSSYVKEVMKAFSGSYKPHLMPRIIANRGDIEYVAGEGYVYLVRAVKSKEVVVNIKEQQINKFIELYFKTLGIEIDIEKVKTSKFVKHFVEEKFPKIGMSWIMGEINEG